MIYARISVEQRAHVHENLKQFVFAPCLFRVRGYIKSPLPVGEKSRAMRRVDIESGVTLDAEFRVHRIDDEKSIAFLGTRWEYSYRLVARAPLDLRLR